jgi:hypothetical protein
VTGAACGRETDPDQTSPSSSCAMASGLTYSQP